MSKQYELLDHKVDQTLGDYKEHVHECEICTNALSPENEIPGIINLTGLCPKGRYLAVNYEMAYDDKEAYMAESKYRVGYKKMLGVLFLLVVEMLSGLDFFSPHTHHFYFMPVVAHYLLMILLFSILYSLIMKKTAGINRRMECMHERMSRVRRKMPSIKFT